LCFSLAISLNVFGASATVGGVTVGSFTMENGAWIRVDENSGNGIKFNAFLDTETYDTLEGLENVTVNYGMVIVPNDLLPEGGITTAMLLDTANNHFTNEECNCGKTHYAIVEYETLPDNPDADNKILRGSIVNIKTGNVVRPYTAVGYIKYVNGGTTEYALAEYANGDIANSTRSMAYVAQKAIDAGQDADGSIEATYVTPYTTGNYANKFPYTVNHYLNGKDQAPVEVETLYGTLGETVTAKHIASGAMASQYKEYGLYVFGADSTTSSVLYADGKTELNCYYEKVNTVFLDGSADEIELDTGYDNGGKYTGLAANLNYNTTETTTAVVSYVDSMQNGEETITDITKVQMSTADAYGAGYMRLGLDNDMYNQAVAADWDYIKIRMYVELANAEGTVKDAAQTLNMYSWNMPLGSITTNQWVEFVVSKAVLNSIKGTNRSYVLMGVNPAPASTESFYTEFGSRYGFAAASSTYFWWTNSVNKNSAYPVVNYYIDEISWGIDIDAPELSLGSDYSKVYAGNFNPTVVVSDNLLSNELYTSAYTSCAELDKKLYKVIDSNRTLVDSESDGSWNLEVGNYVLVITANDKGTSDGEGNVGTQEFAIQVIEEPVRATGYLTDFDIPAETSYLLAKENSGVVPVISYLDTYKDTKGTEKAGVTKYATTSVSGSAWGAYFYLNFSTDMITEITNAFNDTTTDFTLTFSICVEMSNYIDYAYAATNNYGDSVFLTGGSNYTDEFEGGVWTELTFNEEQLANILKWTSDANVKNRLNGSNYIFYMGGWTLTKTLTEVTYYIDSISYSTTPVTAE